MHEPRLVPTIPIRSSLRRQPVDCRSCVEDGGDLPATFGRGLHNLIVRALKPRQHSTS
jgi:hypothetical protein